MKEEGSQAGDGDPEQELANEAGADGAEQQEPPPEEQAEGGEEEQQQQQPADEEEAVVQEEPPPALRQAVPVDFGVGTGTMAGLLQHRTWVARASQNRQSLEEYEPTAIRGVATMAKRDVMLQCRANRSEELNISRRGFNAKCLQELADARLLTLSLKAVDASDNPLNKAGTQVLCDRVVVHSTELKRLRLARCGLDEEGAMEVLGAAVESAHGLVELDLSQNQLQEHHIKVLADALSKKARALQLLRLDMNTALGPKALAPLEGVRIKAVSLAGIGDKDHQELLREWDEKRQQGLANTVLARVEGKMRAKGWEPPKHDEPAEAEAEAEADEQAGDEAAAGLEGENAGDDALPGEDQHEAQEQEQEQQEQE